MKGKRLLGMVVHGLGALSVGRNVGGGSTLCAHEPGIDVFLCAGGIVSCNVNRILFATVSLKVLSSRYRRKKPVRMELT